MIHKEIARGKAKIVASITSAEQIPKAEQSGADIIEARLDLFKSIEKEKLRSSLPLIATNRPKTEGGAFGGTEKERINLLISMLDSVDAVDIELNCKSSAAVIGEARKRGLTTIVSYHDFKKTPHNSRLRAILEKELTTGDIAKIAVMANTIEDVMRMLKLGLEFKGGRICIIAMGALGRHFRAIAPVYGSILAYGAIDEREKTAPSQLTVKELNDLRRLLW